MAYVSFDTADVTSAMGDVLPTVIVHGPVPASTDLETWAGKLQVETWPEGVPLPATPRLEPAASGSGWTIGFASQSSLEDRWYAVAVPPLPEGFAWTSQLMHRSNDDRVRVRFRPGSDVRISWVELCDKGDTVVGAAVFSEEIRVGASADAVIDLNSAQGCTPIVEAAIQGDTHSLASRGITASDGAVVYRQRPLARSRALRFSCPRTKRDDLHVGIVATSATVARVGRKLSMAWSRMAQHGSDCVAMTLPDSL